MIDKRQLVKNLCKLAFVCSFVYFIFYFFIGYQSAVYICLYGMASTILVYALIHFRYSTAIVAHLFCFTTFLFFFLFILTSGGLSSPVLPWLIMIPIAAFQLHDKWYGFLWATVSVLVLLFFYLCSYYQLNFNNELLEQYKNLVHISSTAGLILFVVFSTIIYRDINRKMLAEIALLTKAEEEQRASIHFWIKGQESERKRIALDIHDGIAQMIVSARFKLALVKKSSNDNNSLIDIDNVLKETLSEIKDITSELYPKALEVSGLSNAIQHLANEIRQTIGLKIEFAIDNNLKEFNSTASIHIYRIVQECLKNIVTHSRATNIEIRLGKVGGDCLISVIDNGIGFSTDKIYLSSSNGLFHIKERVNYLKGTIEISSKENIGTTIKIRLPYEN